MNVGLPMGVRRGCFGEGTWACPRELDGAVGGRSSACRRLDEDAYRQGKAQERRTWHATWPVSVGQDPGEAVEAQEGIGHCSGCNSPVMVRIHRRSKALEAVKVRNARFGVRRRAPRIDHTLVRWRNVKRVIQRRRAGGPGGEGKPLESETPWAFPA
jgi:hypothetical protein